MDRHIDIHQKYIEKGHTMMECDSMHAAIQKKVNAMDLFIPADFERAILAARREPYALRRLHWNDFTKLDGQYRKSLRPNVIKANGSQPSTSKKPAEEHPKVHD
jgi:hypothetical protein